MPMDSSGMEQLKIQFTAFQRKHYVFTKRFLLKMAFRALAQTKKLTPIDNGNLINNWELTDVIRSGSNLSIYLINSSYYASFVEEGHWQHKRWLPGSFKGNKFVYKRGSKDGIMLQEKWIEGHFMATISIAKINKEIPQRYNKEFTAFIRELNMNN